MSTLRVLLLGIALLAGGCGEADVEEYEPPPSSPPVTDFTFSTGVYPIIAEQNCNLTCHNATNYLSSLDLDVGVAQMYVNLTAGGSSSYGETLVIDFPEQSLLLMHPTEESGTSHQKYFAVEDPRYETIFGWIANGAQND